MKIVIPVFFVIFMLLTPALKVYGNPPDSDKTKNEEPPMKHTEIDSDFDGKIDQWLFYDKEGALVKTEFDTNKDGKVNQREFYEEKGKRIEIDSNGDGKVDQWGYFETGK